MELSSFLKEIGTLDFNNNEWDTKATILIFLSYFVGCYYSVLMETNVNERLIKESNKVLLLDYLLSELKAAKMIKVNKPDSSMEVTLVKMKFCSLIIWMVSHYLLYCFFIIAEWKFHSSRPEEYVTSIEISKTSCQYTRESII